MTQPIPKRSQSAQSNSGNKTPPTPIKTNHSAVFSGDDGSRKPSSELNWIEQLDPSQKYFGNRYIEGMNRMLFDNKNVFKAYFEPRMISGLTPVASGTSRQTTPRFVPMDLIQKSASQASGLYLVKPHERALVHLAAVISPVGLLLATDDLGKDGCSDKASWNEILFTRMYLLSRPLIKIKGVHMHMGNTLAAVLGQSFNEEDVDLEQVSRLATAVQLSDSRVSSHWTSQINSTQAG